ncbi:hypothetical protein OIU84_002454 [Salix udensis]|uniref:RING-type E3 ubiquitin transferase n=1 Tax=Salix udensis TaxID=889485 RepID=A0AAD6P4T3_9ROSI|nr:hypothetical protein OIU84_002454 [Salix udensis]
MLLSLKTKSKSLILSWHTLLVAHKSYPPKRDFGSAPNVLSFKPKRFGLQQTENPFVVSLQGSLRFRFPVRFDGSNVTRDRRNPKKIHYRPPRIPVRSRYLLFELYGFWSMNTGKLCMVGSGSGDSGGSFGYFEQVSILAIPHFGAYKYTLVDKENEDVGFSGTYDSVGERESLPIDSVDRSMCLNEMYRHTRILELEYGSGCSGDNGGKCNPLSGSSGALPKIVTIQGIRCDHEHGREARVLVGFSNSSFVNVYGPERIFDPYTTLLGEGVWDDKRNRLFVVACRILTFNDSLANATVATFPGIGFHGSEFRIRRLPGLAYEYTMLDKVHKSCAEKKSMKGKGKTYPYGYSSDMRFDMLVRNVKGHIAQGTSTPLFVGYQLFEQYPMTNNYSGHLNISYKIVFTGMLPLNESGTISAEGTYDDENGVLCMIGCRHLISRMGNSMKNDSTDCEILVNVQFSPLNGKGQGNIKGTIESIRKNSDPLHFEKLEISSNSIYRHQAVASIWRMDMEITMVLISNTLACILMGLQLYHVKRHPDVLPFISFVMLLVLTLGHMIPLLLNFEALFLSNRNQQNVFLESGGWLEVNEVAVRVVKMAAFLLIFRLLQLTWSARKSDEIHKSLWISEKRVLYLSLPIYIVGGLIACENALAPSFFAGTTVIRLLPHAYDLYRAHSSAWYLDLSYLYANHTYDFYSTAWDIVIPLCGLLFATLIYLQQQFGGHCFLPKRFRGGPAYEKKLSYLGTTGVGHNINLMDISESRFRGRGQVVDWRLPSLSTCSMELLPLHLKNAFQASICCK